MARNTWPGTHGPDARGRPIFRVNITPKVNGYPWSSRKQPWPARGTRRKLDDSAVALPPLVLPSNVHAARPRVRRCCTDIAGLCGASAGSGLPEPISDNPWTGLTWEETAMGELIVEANAELTVTRYTRGLIGPDVTPAGRIRNGGRIHAIAPP